VENDKTVFGKDCEYFSGVWCIGDWFTSVAFCSHPDNPEDTEGNCRKEICPLLREKV